MIGSTDNWSANYTRVLFDEPPPLLVIEVRGLGFMGRIKVSVRLTAIYGWPYRSYATARRRGLGIGGGGVG